MKTFSEFISNIDPEFFEGFEKKDDKKAGKKLPPWLMKGKKDDKSDDDKGDKAEKSDDKKSEDKPEETDNADKDDKKVAKKNPFLKGKKD